MKRLFFCENPAHHQQSLNAFQKYWEIWKLTINTDKTKVLIFSNGRISKNVHFLLNNTELENILAYIYREVAKKHTIMQANKALFLL